MLRSRPISKQSVEIRGVSPELATVPKYPCPVKRRVIGAYNNKSDDPSGIKAGLVCYIRVNKRCQSLQFEELHGESAARVHAS